MRRRHIRAGLLLCLLMPSPLAWGQAVPGAPTAPPAQTEPPKDALGRDTPRGTVLGFMSAARSGEDEITPQYLDTRLTGQAAVDLAHKLYVVLDTRLPARLNELSDQPEGLPDNPLRPDQNVVGTIDTAGGPFDVVVQRVTRRNAAPVWLFSAQTLSRTQDAYDEIDPTTADRFVRDILNRPRIAGIRLSAWLALFLLLPLSYRMLRVLDWLYKPFVLLWRRRSDAPARQAGDRLPGLVRLVVLGIAIHWILATIELPLLERQFWSTVATLLMIVALGWSGFLLNSYGERYVHRRLAGVGEATSLLRIMRRGADVLVIVICGLVVFRYFGFNPTTALAGLGIGGIAVALAAQKTLENVIAGLSLIVDKAVRVGDSLKFGDAVGTVDRIGLRSTRIRTLDRTMLSVPNGQIASGAIETLSARDKFWFHHSVGLRYGTTVEQMRSVIDGVHTLLLTQAGVDSETIRVRFLRLGSFSLEIDISAYLFARDWDRFLEIQQELLLRIMEAIAGAGTAIAFPSQTLHIADGQMFDPNVLAASPGETPSSVSVRARKPV